jgi:hypothetical protein
MVNIVFVINITVIHHMYRNHDYFGDGSVHDMWKLLMIQTI